MKLKCQNCQRVWDYTGKQEYQTTCPRCSYKVNINKNRVVDDG